MNTHLDGLVVADRLEEAREFAARQRLIAALRPTRSPVRALVGLALIRAGRWVAGQTPRGSIESHRVSV